MSKIGKLPIKLENGVTATVTDGLVTVKGPKGELTFKPVKEVEVKLEGSEIKVSAKKDNKFSRANWGTTRKIISNMVLGVSNGWQKKLELVGTGYRAEVQGNTLVLTVGYSHPVKIEAPSGVTFKVEKNVIIVDGNDRQVIGQVSANIRATRPPEPYKGKGVKYVGEVIRRKAGKAAKAAA